MIKNIFKKLFFKKQLVSDDSGVQPEIVARHAHTVSRKNISPNALKVLYKLQKKGFSAYLVGGGVRDLLLGKTPKDFDIATDARPEQVKALFPRALIIGRRFRLVHVRFRHEVIEVSTFRGNSAGDSRGQRHNDTGQILSDNQYGTEVQDAFRRDFTINALFYNPKDYTVKDYVGGLSDLENRVIRVIGDPAQRFREDPVRMLRAIRFAAKLGFTIEPSACEQIEQDRALLSHVSPARLQDEVLKFFQYGFAKKSLDLLGKHGVLPFFFPETAEALDSPDGEQLWRFLSLSFASADERIALGKSTTPAFCLAVWLWHPFQKTLKAVLADPTFEGYALHEAMGLVFARQVKVVTIPRYIEGGIREIWELQHVLESRYPKRVLSVLHHKRFRAAFDFFLLRASAGEVSLDIAQWWEEIQTKKIKEQLEMITLLPKPSSRRKRRARKK